MDLSLSTHLITMLKTSPILAMLDAVGSNYAIVTGREIPSTMQSLSRILQIYRVSPIGAEDVSVQTYTINCRQANEVNADTLAGLVYNEVNRTIKTYVGAGIYTQCTIGACIREEENHWNTPVDVRIFSRR